MTDARLVRLHHYRRRFRRLRAGQPPDRLGPPSRPLAGGRCHDRHLWIHIPLGYGKLFADSRVNWLYKTEPEPELDNRQVIQPRGKVLGGSSSINGLLYLRGQPADYDHWRQLGNSGWSFDDVLPYFRRAEHQERGEGRAAWSRRAARCLQRLRAPSAVRGVHRRPHSRGYPRNDDLTGRRRRAPAISSSRRRMAGAGRRRSAILREARRDPISSSKPTRWRAVSCLRGGARSGSNTGRATRRGLPAPAARSSWPGGRSTRRS